MSFGKGFVALDGVSLLEINNRAAEDAEQDQTAQGYDICGVYGHEVDSLPPNYKVSRLIPGSRYQLNGHTVRVSTDVLPRKQN